jgi:hypothetical protein
MAGESVAGVLEIGFRIVTKAAVKSNRVGALVFFSLSLLFIVLCVFCHLYIRRSEVVEFYTGKCRSSELEDRSLSELQDLGSTDEEIRDVPSDFDQELLLGDHSDNSAEVDTPDVFKNSIDPSGTESSTQLRQKFISQGTNPCINVVLADSFCVIMFATLQ